MPTPWSNPIKATKQLKIFPTANVSKGPWAGVFTNAIAEFNKLSAKHSLGVTFVLAKNAPDPSGVGGADAQIDAINGTVSFICFNQTFSEKLDGASLAGITSQVKTAVGSTQTIDKAFIWVPATPRIGDVARRVAGDPIKLVIAAHELIHACGLDNRDHSKDDLFFGFPNARQGNNPAGDKVEVGNPTKLMPPLFLLAPTIKLIQSNWK